MRKTVITVTHTEPEPCISVTHFFCCWKSHCSLKEASSM